MTVFHPPFVHFPITLCLLASVAGSLYLYWRPLPLLRILTWWPMLLGWVATIMAMLTGLFDQRDIAPDVPFRTILNSHIGTGLALFVVYGWLLYRRWLFNSAKAKKERDRKGVTFIDLLDDPSARLWITVLLILGSLLVIASGWNGGRLVYEWGVNVGN